jgi:hypothetical protein
MKVEKVAFDPKWLESGEFVICDVEEAQEKGVFTNRLDWPKKEPTKLGVLVAYKSQRDFAISQNGMEYIRRPRRAAAQRRCSCCCYKTTPMANRYSSKR